MDILSSVTIGLSLAADAMAAAVSCGIKNNNSRRSTAFRAAGLFAGFQMIMPVLGWSIGRVAGGMLGGMEHIAAFVILVLLGLKMLYDAGRDPLKAAGGMKELILLSVATSIDALAVGTVLPAAAGADTPLRMFLSIVIIGSITFVLSFAGYRLGRRFSRFRASYAGAAGGLLLIVLGIKTLIFH